MAMRRLARLATRAPAAVFAALGRDSERLLAGLALLPDVEMMHTPRHAALLLVIGELPQDYGQLLQTLHDQLPHPRATIWWRSSPLFEWVEPALETLSMATTDATAVRNLLQATQAKLLLGERPSEPDLKPDSPPNEWQGRGDHGQGGEGMMGGTPYGRPMAMVEPDRRDGLALDQLGFQLGPFIQGFPPGLCARVELQGDLICQWEVCATPFPLKPDPLFLQALNQPVAISALELARVRSHLRRVATMLRGEGLATLAHRSLELAVQLKAPDLNYGTLVKPVNALLKRIERSGFLRPAPGVGRLQPDEAMRLGGFTARASGLNLDARTDNPTYHRLDFQPIRQQHGDLGARRRQLLAEIRQSLNLAEQSAQASLLSEPGGVVESPLGPIAAHTPSEEHSALLQELLPGLEWSDALRVIPSLPLARLETV